MSVEYPNILDKSVNELFTTYSIVELSELKGKLSVDVNVKSTELRTLVGSKYRDLLKVADDIIKMNEITKIENDQLVNLTFKKSNYNTKALKNLSKFNRSLTNRQIQQIQKDNKYIVLKNLVHDLNYSLINLENNLVEETEILNNVENSNLEDLNKSEEIYNTPTVSESIIGEFIQLSKHIYLIELFFKEDIESDNSFTIFKFKKLKNDFNTLIKNQLIIINNDNDSEFGISILISYIISNKSTPLDSLSWFLGIRLSEFEKLCSADTNFQQCLRYVFITVNFSNLFKSRIPLMLHRLIYNSVNSNWVFQTSFKRWCKWLNIPEKLTIEFPISNSESKISNDQFDKIVNCWTLKIGSTFNTLFNNKFSIHSSNLNDLASLLNNILISFKNFTSLATMKYVCENKTERSLLDSILLKWKSKYFEILKNDLHEFDQISKLILLNFNKESVLKEIHTNNGLNLFDFVDVSDIDTFMLQVTDKSHSNSNIDSIFIQLDNFKIDLKSIIASVESLQKLSNSITRPILSIDDYEDDGFWLSMSQKITKLINESITSSKKVLNKSIIKFFRNVEDLITTGSYSNIRYFYLIRVLVQLTEKIELAEIYDKFNTYSTETSSDEVNMNEHTEPLLVKCFKSVIDNVIEKYLIKLESTIKDRFNKTQNYAEFLLWESYGEGNKIIPHGVSIDLSKLVYNFVCELLRNENDDYSDVYLLKSFNIVEKDAVERFMVALGNGIEEFNDIVEEDRDQERKTEEDKQEKAATKILGNKIKESLLTYSDLLFLSCFIQDEELSVDNLNKFITTNQITKPIFAKLIKANDDLKNEKYKSVIDNAIIENFKSQSLMFYPLNN